MLVVQLLVYCLDAEILVKVFGNFMFIDFFGCTKSNFI